MTERALSEVWNEVRHYALNPSQTYCGGRGVVTTCRAHVTCEGCLSAMRGFLPQRRLTLGDSAVAELAELRGRVKELELHYQDQAGVFAGEEKLALAYRIMADDLRDLLDEPARPEGTMGEAT